MFNIQGINEEHVLYNDWDTVWEVKVNQRSNKIEERIFYTIYFEKDLFSGSFGTRVLKVG